MRTIYLYLLDTMAEWEIGNILQAMSMADELGLRCDFQIKTLANSKQPIRTQGGLLLTPDFILNEISTDNIAALLLPGATTWNLKENSKILLLAEILLKRGTLVAAICGSTLGLADRGMLNNYAHTSNSLDYLKTFSEKYQSERFYHQTKSVRDQNLITASSAGALEWARDILIALEIYPSNLIETWYHYFLTGNPLYYKKILEMAEHLRKQTLFA